MQIRCYKVDLGQRGSIGDITARIGLAAYPGDAEEPADVIQAAKTIAMSEDFSAEE